MKKVFLMMVMLFTMGVCTFAENNSTTDVENIAKYDLKINNRKLAVYLDLTTDQMDAVASISDEFANDLKFAAVECSNTARKQVMENVITKNIKYMYYILNHEQMRKYLMVLNATLKNRELE